MKNHTTHKKWKTGFRLSEIFARHNFWSIRHTKNENRPTFYDKSTNGSRLLMAEEVINAINEQNSKVLFDLDLKEFKEANNLSDIVAFKP